METMTPSELFMIIGLCVAVLIGKWIYDSWQEQRESTDDDYDKSGDAEPTHDPQPKPAAPPVAATSPTALQPVATGYNERNEDLPRNERNERLRVQADIIARLLQSGVYVPNGNGGYKQIKQTAMIKLITGLSPNSRVDSDYGQLRAELEELINPQLLVAAGRPEERQIAKV